MKKVIFVLTTFFMSVGFSQDVQVNCDEKNHCTYKVDGKEVKPGSTTKMKNGWDYEAPQEDENSYKYNDHEPYGSSEWPTPSAPAPVGDTKKSDWW